MLPRVDARLRQHLRRVLAEKRRPTDDAPRTPRRDERAAGIEEVPPELRMMHRHPETARVQMRIVEVLVRRPHRRPGEPLRLPGTVDLVGGVERAVVSP